MAVKSILINLDMDLEKYAIDLSATLRQIANAKGVTVDPGNLHPKIVQNHLEKHPPIQGITEYPSISLRREFEYNFFYNLHYDKNLESFFHYTSLESLFYILDSGKLRLNCLTALNDKSEINYVNNSMLGELDNPYNNVTISYHNYHFVFCFSELFDDLNQWRLYGDNTKGVMIEFNTNLHSGLLKNILLSKVSYNLDVFNIIKEWLSYSEEIHKAHFGFAVADYWKFFYKNYRYKDEKEVRLIIKNTEDEKHRIFKEHFKLNKTYSIISPYIELDCFNSGADMIYIKSITIGPNFPEQDLNISQLQYMLRKKYQRSEITVKKSEINHHR